MRNCREVKRIPEKREAGAGMTAGTVKTAGTAAAAGAFALILAWTNCVLPGQITVRAEDSGLEERAAQTENSGPEEYAAQTEELFVKSEIDDEILDRILGKSYVENPDIAPDQLRYLKVAHYNFDHEVQTGELIVNAALADEFLEIFEELYEAEYEIQSMYLIDNYWTGDAEESDTASIEENNTSAFCYRTILSSGNLSNHALGGAIDINPMQNPYVTFDSDGNAVVYHKNAEEYIDRSQLREHMITQQDVCYQIFIEHGFRWGGDWNNPKDYQHFEYPKQELLELMEAFSGNS